MSSDELPSPRPCDACGKTEGPLIKLSLGKDFFGRIYDRLSPTSDTSPKWFCETCSMHKTLQRDFRDIQAEAVKWCGGESSELGSPGQFDRAKLRLREIQLFIEQAGNRSLFLKDVEVKDLLRNIQDRMSRAGSELGSPTS